MAIVYSPEYMVFGRNTMHPESSKRMVAIVKYLDKRGLWSDVISPTMDCAEYATAIPETIHSWEYLDMLASGDAVCLDPDTVCDNSTFTAARLSAAGALMAAKAAAGGEPSIALVRPPGHHANRDFCGGFCYLNNIAIAAEVVLQTHGMDRIAIVDVDAHHGNGTANIFKGRRDILYVSTHQYGIYPGTGAMVEVGEDGGRGYTVNIPFNEMAGDESFRQAFDRIIMPILRQYKPDMVLVSYGGDAHYMDLLTDLTLSSEGYSWINETLVEYAIDELGGRIAYVLEGGYNLKVMGELCASVLDCYAGRRPLTEFNKKIDATGKCSRVVDRVWEFQSRFWML